MDLSHECYLKYYESQAGGSIPVFNGSRRYHPQSGAGLGDILQGVFRTVVPIALNGVGNFVDQMASAHVAGSSLRNSAKSALGSVTKSILQDAAGSIKNSIPVQSGRGRTQSNRIRKTRRQTGRGRSKKAQGYNTRAKQKQMSTKRESLRTRNPLYIKRANPRTRHFSNSISDSNFNF